MKHFYYLPESEISSLQMKYTSNQLGTHDMESGPNQNKLARVVQKVDNAIHWMNHYRANTYIHTYIALFVNAGWEMGSQRLMWTCLYNYNILRFKIQIKLVNK